jgi:hypothetical protein
LREAVHIGEKPIVLEAKQIKKTSLIKILAAHDSTGNNEEIKEVAEWMLFTE